MTAFDYSPEHNAFVKHCSKCSTDYIGTQDQAESEAHFAKHFYPNGGRGDGLSSWCKPCQIIATKRWKYGEHDAVAMLKEQDGRCAICQVEIKFNQGKGHGAFVDHDHKTGVVRGILCKGCNSGIGFLQHKSSVLRSAIAYLEKYEAVE